ncbi:MAG TPA: serine/threonine-protein kinase, partial [Luteolibacter sp.]|nr:serine/threonine-protein kinase [Luteolibacter sp.]
MAEDPQTIDTCEACKAPMDVSSVAPFTTVECPTCGAHSKVKVKFGPYTLARRHAIGGMSMVFSAFDSTLGREVAVKILSEEYSQDDTRIRAFEEEARITASFSHPNVVRVLRTGRAFGRFYIAMELVPGGHFEHHIREKGRIPEAEMLPLAIEVAQGLKAAKAAGLIHRDVKPGNILLDSEGHAKLVDFGLALVTQGGKARATELWATPFYVPPETVEGKEEDFRSDIYALGSTLYHALAGIPPCNEDTMATDRLLKAKREVIPLKAVAPDVSDMTCAIVDQAMAYDPDARFSSYDDLILCLRNAQTLLRKGPYRIVPQQEPSRKGAAMWIVGSAIAAALVSAYLFWPDDHLKPQPPPDDPNPNTNITPVEGEEIIRTFGRARKELAEGQFQTAAEKFMRLNENAKVQEPSRSWAGVEAVLCLYLDGDVQGARKQALVARQHLL